MLADTYGKEFKTAFQPNAAGDVGHKHLIVAILQVGMANEQVYTMNMIVCPLYSSPEIQEENVKSRYQQENLGECCRVLAHLLLCGSLETPQMTGQQPGNSLTFLEGRVSAMLAAAKPEVQPVLITLLRANLDDQVGFRV